MFKVKIRDEEEVKEETTDQQQINSQETQTIGEIETIVGPSVEVEGDFSSKGNMVVQGTVAGNVKTAKNLRVEEGARILASVKAQNSQISGEIQGSVTIKETLELTSSAVVIGDVSAATLIIEAGAIMHGKCSMPGPHTEKSTEKSSATKTSSRKRTHQTTSTETTTEESE